MTTIFLLDECPINSRNGNYGGKAGDKEGITIDGEPHFFAAPALF